MSKVIITTFFIITLTGKPGCFGDTTTVAVQPFGNIKKQLINEIAKDIQKQYDVKVIILPKMKLPSKTYYPPNKRYRGDRILKFLNSTGNEYTKILGLTDVDISTTKGAIKDWGIFGLGSVGGRACVVSTFRLKRGNPSRKRFYNRIINVVIHELGHTFGLWHCPNRNCIMQDARGKMTSVDKEPYTFCLKCTKKIQKVLKK